MKRIYTRTGDKGTTTIFGRTPVAKTDIRIEANGTLDELNVEIGMARTLMPDEHPWQQPLKDIQLTLMGAMSLVATPSARIAEDPNTFPDGITQKMEELIDSITASHAVPEHFILPGGTAVSAQLHRCRVTARRAERRLWQLNDTDEMNPDILRFVNRLSDLFFVMARCEMLNAGLPEERWKAFSYKRSPKKE